MTYDDPYLRPLITTDRESRAAADVALLGDLDETWADRLKVLRAYILTCLESSTSAEDSFAAKLAEYRREYKDAVAAARAATAAAGTTVILASVSLERG